MTDKPLSILSFNVNHTPTTTKTVLERHTNYDIIFIQEPHYGVLKRVTSSSDPDGEAYFGTQAHPDWLLIQPIDLEHARAVCYIHRRWQGTNPTRRTDIISHPHLLCFSLTIQDSTHFFLNVYADPRTHSSLEYLYDLSNRLPSFALVCGDFNLHHKLWDSAYGYRDNGQQLIDFMPDLSVSLLNTPDVHTHFPHNTSLSSTVIDLAWVDHTLLQSPSTSLIVDAVGRDASDHAKLLITLPLFPEFAPPPRIKRKSDEEVSFLIAACGAFPPADNITLDDADSIQTLCDTIFNSIKEAFHRYATTPKITARSKRWWNNECRDALRTYRDDRSQENRRAYFRTVKAVQKAHYQTVIDEVVANHRVWDLTSWTRPRPLPTTSIIKDRHGAPLTSLQELANGFQQQFFSAADRPVDYSTLDALEPLPTRSFAPISQAEMVEQAATCAARSSPGPDHITWPVVKILVEDPVAGPTLLKIFNACLRLAYWPTQFKVSTTVVIPKPKKPDYTVLKAYRPIVLLSCLGKLCEKILANRLQFEALKHNIFHASQCGGVKAHCTEDAGVLLVHHVLAARSKGMHTSCLAVDIAQFYPSVPHELLSRVLERQGFAPEYVAFFRAYLTDRVTQFRWNNNLSDPCPANVGVGQGSALSPVLANLCIAPILHIFSISLPRPRMTIELASMLFYVDDGVLIYSSDSMGQNVIMLKLLFSRLRSLFLRLGFVLEPDKLELMHFPLPRSSDNLPSLSIPADPPALPVTLQPLFIWRYLGFFFDCQLNFRHHVNFYATRALSTIRSYPLLGNSSRGLSPSHKRQIYISCVLPVLTYGVRVWYNPRKPRLNLTKPLRRAQTTASRWITGSFRTSPAGGMEVLAGLLPVPLHLKKLYQRSHLRVPRLPAPHVLLRSLPDGLKLPTIPPTSFTYGPALRRLPAQSSLPLHFISEGRPEHIEDALPLHPECHPGKRLVDTFSSSIQYDISHPKKSSDLFPQWLDQFRTSLSLISEDPDSIFAFSDGSVLTSQGNRAAASFRAFRGQQELFKWAISCGHATSYDAELFGLYMAIRHLTQVDATSIHLYCDNEAALRTLFDTRNHASQMLSVMACKSAREWLDGHPDRSIHLHWCLGHVGIDRNELVDGDAKEAATSLPITPYISHAFARQRVTSGVTREWHQLAQLRSHVGHSFFPNPRFRKVSHINGGPFLSAFGDSSPLAARMARTILNHAPIGEFRSRFFPHENANCNWCPGIRQTRRHILNSCTHYKRPRERFLEFLINSSEPGAHLASFLTDNMTAFSFTDAPATHD